MWKGSAIVSEQEFFKLLVIFVKRDTYIYVVHLSIQVYVC